MGPAGTPVDKMYKALLAKGMSKKDAAKTAQAKTGLALVTGKPPKRPKRQMQYSKKAVGL